MQANYLIDSFRNKDKILAIQKKIFRQIEKIPHKINIMEVCGGHTHSIMQYGLNKLLPKNIEFIHGPGCPVCVMPKDRIDQAYEIAREKDIILVTLGDMIRVPGSKGNLQKARSLGCDVRFVYSPLEAITIAKENRHKKVVFFAIGFETTTPMTAALIERRLQQNINNLFFHINHLLVPPPLRVILDSKPCYVNALIAPSHVSVIAGAKIYLPFLKYKIPIVVGGFEPLDIMDCVLRIVGQVIENNPRLDIEYNRVVSMQGNLKAQGLVEKYFSTREHFMWRGLGDIKDSALRLRDEYSDIDAEKIFENVLPKESIRDNKACICGSILRGVAKPTDCKVFGKACTPQTPIGSCMVSSEGACAAYYKYKDIV